MIANGVNPFLSRMIGLNPCFGGSWVMIVLSINPNPRENSLNPCFGGSWVMIPLRS